MFSTLENIKRYKNLHTAADILTAKATSLIDRADAKQGNVDYFILEAWHCLKHAAEMLTEASQMELGGKYV